jgi:hypothetical protein
MVDVGKVRQEDWRSVAVHCVKLRVGTVVAVKKIGCVRGFWVDASVIDAEGGKIERLEQACEQSVHAAFGHGEDAQLGARNGANHQDLVGI